MSSITRTISNEKELNEIFGIKNEIRNEKIKLISEDEIINYDFKPNYDFTNYYAMQAIKDGFFDLETWNKIVEFEKNNPDKIKKWREEDEETREYYNRNNNILVNRNDKKEIRETCEEKVIKLCLKKYPKSKFVISVSEYYKRTCKISEKQMNILRSMI